MKGLMTPLKSSPYRDGSNEWNGKDFIILSPLIYHTKRGIKISVPVGFITNFCTYIVPTGRYIEASVIHDYLYSPRGSSIYGTNRRDADDIFKEMMERAGCPRWRINAFYYALRLFGWIAYKGI